MSILSDGMEIATIYKQMGFGGVLGIAVGMAVFVYVAGLVYGTLPVPDGAEVAQLSQTSKSHKIHS